MALVSDTFTGTTGALLRLRPGWTYSGAATYQDRATISNNRLRCGGTSGTSVHYCFGVETGDVAHFVEARFLRFNAVGACLYLRWVDPNNFIAIRNSGTSLELLKRVGGTITQLGIVSGALSGSEIIRATVRGSVVKLYRNGVQIGLTAGFAASDAVLQSSTKAGLGGEGTFGSQEYFDDFQAGPLPAALAPADGRSPGRADAAVLTGARQIAAADGRSPGRGDPTEARLRLRLTGRSASHPTRSDTAGAGLRLRLGVTDGQSTARSAPATLATRNRLTPGDAWLRLGDDPAAVGWSGRLRPRRGGARMRSTRALHSRFGGPPLATEALTASDGGDMRVTAETHALVVPADGI
ncbi:MAG: hypothetical protein INF91_09065 [Alphaproteobacteria bacterium]|nr:hypothetical protein [Alphaproteobacteria bacterium]